MKYKSYNCNSFNVHTIKTDKFKTCHMEIIFRKEVKKEELGTYTLLADILTESSKKYPSRKKMVTRLEELYKTIFYGTTTKVGKTVMMSLILDFISPDLINEKGYLEEIIEFPFDILQNPNATNAEFDLTTFKIVKSRLERDIKSIKENGYKYSIKRTFESMDPESPTSFSVLGTLEALQNTTPANLYQYYKNLYKDTVCDIFVVGNLDMDEVVTLIKKKFNKRIINNKNIELYVDNKTRKKVSRVEEKGEFLQSNINVIYNLVGLNEKERNITFNIYNYIFGSGGLTSRLYREIREKNSLCYSIDSMYLKYDNLLVIHVGLDEVNKEKCLKLINKVVKDFELGKFSEEELQEAKNNIINSLKLALDNPTAILNNHIFNVFYDLPAIEERIEMIKNTTKEEVMEVAKKIKANLIYVMNGSDMN